jgi:hypothetical protein
MFSALKKTIKMKARWKHVWHDGWKCSAGTSVNGELKNLPHGMLRAVLAALATSKNGEMSQWFLLRVENQKPKHTTYAF